MSNLQKTVGNNIKDQRALKGISQGELAKTSGIGQARLSRVENGQIDVGLQTIEKIAKGLGLPPAELLIESSNPETSINEKLLQVRSLNEYDQKLIEAILENFIEKNRLENMQGAKMKSRLEELEKLRGSK